MSKQYNTPKRKCVVKTRLTEDERKAFEDKCSVLSMSQSEYIRQAVFYSRIAPVKLGCCPLFSIFAR